MPYALQRVSQEMRRRIAAQVIKARSLRNPNDPIICDLLVPPDMAKVMWVYGAVWATVLTHQVGACVQNDERLCSADGRKILAVRSRLCRL